MIRVLLAGVALILVALTFDASVLLVPGVALAVLALTVPPWIRLAARRASVARRLHGERVVEEQPLEATIEFRRGPLGIPGGELIDEFAGGKLALRGHRPQVRAGCSTVRVVARFPRRGRRRFAPPTLILRDPLGLVRVSRGGTGAAEELLVLPRTERISWPADELGMPAESAVRAQLAEALAAVEVDGLRPYRPGAPASRIHWPAVARGAGLLERRLRAEADTGPLVALDARHTGPVAPLDAAVRAAASLTLELARRGGCELLLPGERRPLRIASDLAAWPAAHAQLALVEGGPDAPAPALGTRPRSGSVFYVLAGPPGRLDGLPTQVRPGAVVVVPIPLAGELRRQPLFDVAGCRAFALDARRAREAA